MDTFLFLQEGFGPGPWTLFLNNENRTKTEIVQKYDLTRRCRPLIVKVITKGGITRSSSKTCIILRKQAGV